MTVPEKGFRLKTGRLPPLKRTLNKSLVTDQLVQQIQPIESRGHPDWRLVMVWWLTRRVGNSYWRASSEVCRLLGDPAVALVQYTDGLSNQQLLLIAEDQSFYNAEYNQAFVEMEYFGYLRRDPDEGGFNFWLRKLTQFGGDFRRADMVKSFLVSANTGKRFGPP